MTAAPSSTLVTGWHVNFFQLLPWNQSADFDILRFSMDDWLVVAANPSEK